jgi:hypothetical protein
MKTCVHVNVKDEIRIIEFINYYLKIGIDYFIIMDDDSKQDTKELLLQNNINKNIFTVLYTNKRRFLFGIYNSYEYWKNELLPILYQQKIDYILYIDADEFLFINKFQTIDELINEYQPFDQLKINWLLFGSNHLFENNSKSIIQPFIKSNDYLNSFVKCLTKVSSIHIEVEKEFISNSHFINIQKNGIVKNIFNQIVEKNSMEEVIHIHYKNAPIYLAHYMIQDSTTYIHRKIYLPIFLKVSCGYTIRTDIIQSIQENETLLKQFFHTSIDNYNNNIDVKKIVELTNLPKRVVIFLHNHFHTFDCNSCINHDILDFFMKD